MDPGEAFILGGMVLLTLFFVSALMVSPKFPPSLLLFSSPITITTLFSPHRLASPSDSTDTTTQIGTAWFFGARFDSLWKTDSVYWSGTEPGAATPLTTPLEHNEL